MSSSKAGIWSLDCIAICTLLGLALDQRQMKKLCMRFELGASASGDHAYCFYLLHRACHQEGGHLPKYLAKHFNERYADVIHRVRSLTLEDPSTMPDEMQQLMETRPGALLWAMLTDSRKPYSACGHYLVHRFSYAAFRAAIGVAVEAKKDWEFAASQQRDLACARRLAERHKRVLDTALDRIKAAETREESLRRSSTVQAARIRELENRPGEEARLRKRIRDLEHQLEQEQRRTKCLNVALSVASESPAEPELLPCDDSCAECEESCPLDALRVAVVGGLDRLEGRYREVVEELGADFDFHNGNTHGGSQSLKNMVCRSDIVVFFTPINSHGALDAVKGMCRKTGKRFVALSRTGPQALADALRDAA